MVGREEGRFLVMRIQEILILAGEEEDRGIGGDEEEGERGENERRGGGGGVLGDAGSANLGRRPRVPASLKNTYDIAPQQLLSQLPPDLTI